MKIIELLTKIANGEEVPKKIKYLTSIYTLRSNNNYYVENSDSSHINGLYYQMIGGSRLNEEVEIIEEDKKIEKLTTSLINIKVLTDEIDTKLDYSGDYDRLVNKINEIIDYINKEK